MARDFSVPHDCEARMRMLAEAQNRQPASRHASDNERNAQPKRTGDADDNRIKQSG